MTASSSEFEAEGTTYVQLRLRLRDTLSDEECYEHMEMKLEKFYDFLIELERAKAQLELT